MTPLIPYSDSGPPLVLSPANGFPPLVYSPLLTHLRPHFQIWLAEHRPIWSSARQPIAALKKVQWRHLASDLVNQIEQQNLPPIILLGHSLGAVLGVMAAARRPELFRQLILVDPVFFPARNAHLLRWLPWSLKRKIPIIKKTLRRPEQFPSMQAAFKFHRRASAFKNLSDDALWAYIEHGFEPVNEQVRLRYGKDWEAVIYGSLPNLLPELKRLDTPTLIARAELSNTLETAQWQRWQALKPEHEFIEFSGSEHLLPLTEPERLATALQPFLAKL